MHWCRAGACSALTNRSHHLGTLQDRINIIFDEEEEPPRIHPIIDIVAEEWGLAEASEDGRKPDLSAMSLLAVAERCREGLAAHPEWVRKLHMSNLPTLLQMQSEEDYWWLPPLEVEDIPGA
jgi:hypothetical protein